MYQNCFTAGPFTEMKSTLCQVHRWSRPRVHGSPEALWCPSTLDDAATTRPTGERRRCALSISVCNEPFHQFGDIARRITFGMALPTSMTATCNRLHVSGLLHEYTSCSAHVTMAVRGKSSRNAEICGERAGSKFPRHFLLLRRDAKPRRGAQGLFVIWRRVVTGCAPAAFVATATRSNFCAHSAARRRMGHPLSRDAWRVTALSSAATLYPMLPFAPSKLENRRNPRSLVASVTE
ncbi:hypothetical protein X777_11670 [Ooceraea biroi]|uniref:Uncharacterized protein n=1 Tax=Ooceraea biroi TaxID=2015173 RepID=A0A026W157_OOCBI|nr:hypothetical protein X777_11670 [Ooceraea biroi]